MDGKYRVSPIRLAKTNFTAYSTAAWKDETHLVINMRPIEATCRRTIEFAFSKNSNNVSFKPSRQQSIYALAANLAQDVEKYFPGPMVVVGTFAFDQLPKIIDSVHKGKIE